MSGVESLPERIASEGLQGIRVAIGDEYLRRLDCLAVARRDGVWSTFYVDERSSIEERSARTYADESSAVEGFLERLRLQKRKVEIHEELRERRRHQGE
jgi:hypothetical protein